MTKLLMERSNWTPRQTRQSDVMSPSELTTRFAAAGNGISRQGKFSTATDGFSSLSTPRRKTRKELLNTQFASLRLTPQTDSRPPLAQAFDTVSMDTSISNSSLESKSRVATRSILKNKLTSQQQRRSNTTWNRKVTWREDVKVIFMDSNGNVLSVAERLRYDIQNTPTRIGSPYPGARRLPTARNNRPLTSTTTSHPSHSPFSFRNGVENSHLNPVAGVSRIEITTTDLVPQSPSLTRLRNNPAGSAGLHNTRHAAAPQTRVHNGTAESRPPTPLSKFSRLQHDVTIDARPSTPLLSKFSRLHRDVNSERQSVTQNGVADGSPSRARTGHVPSSSGVTNIPSGDDKVNITFSTDSSFSGTKLKFVLDLGSGYDANDVIVRAHTNGSRLRVMAQRKEDIVGGNESIVHEFNRKFALPMNVDPHSLEAKLDASGHLTVEAPLANNGNMAPTRRRTASALS